MEVIVWEVVRMRELALGILPTSGYLSKTNTHNRASIRKGIGTIRIAIRIKVNAIARCHVVVIRILL